MGAQVIFLGDRVSAAGFRLGGARVVQPADGAEGAAFAEALGTADLVLITAELASRLPEGQLRAARMALHPLLLVVPDVQGRQGPVDDAARLRRQLGMAE